MLDPQPFDRQPPCWKSTKLETPSNRFVNSRLRPFIVIVCMFAGEIWFCLGAMQLTGFILFFLFYRPAWSSRELVLHGVTVLLVSGFSPHFVLAFFIFLVKGVY